MTKPTPEEIENFDITCTVAPLYDLVSETETEKWPMYSYERPAYLLWQATGRALFAQGWKREEIKAVLQSKLMRWELDGELGEALDQLGEQLATRMEAHHDDAKHWAREPEIAP